MVVTTGFATYDVVSRWHDNWGAYFLNPEDEWENYCITWLRQHYPDQQLSVWTLSYHNIYTYYRNEVRHGFVGSDFYHAQPIPSTIFNGNLVPRSFGPSELLPEFALGGPHFDANWLKVNGYVALPGSADPFSSDRAPCVYRRDNAYSYAFWITRRDLKANANFLPPSAITPITTFVRDYDRIALLAQAKSDADVVVAVQELAYPGWTVQIDGQLCQAGVGRRIDRHCAALRWKAAHRLLPIFADRFFRGRGDHVDYGNRLYFVLAAR